MRDVFDVIVVGSGAGGGMSSHVLSGAGVKVLLLEAGRDYNPVTETPMFNLPKDAPLRAASTPDKPRGYFDATVDGGWQVPGEPYTVADGSAFQWWRARMLGGRTNHWGRVSLRYGPYDFKPFSRDAMGVDWPIGYEELAPWYDKTETLIGVTGARDGLENAPDSPPGVHMPPPPPSPSEYYISRGFESLGIPVAAARLAILTRPLNGRAPCFYATPCVRGCSIGANFQSGPVLIDPARRSGNLTVRTNALVYQVDLDKKGRAQGVSFVDRKSGQHSSVRAKAVVLAASTCESARILLNSRSASFPDGLANETGLVGRHLMDSVTYLSVGQFPALENLPLRPDDQLGGGSAGHIYVPWWGYGQQSRRELDFARGYHIEMFGGGRKMPGTSSLGPLADDCETTHGVGFRDELRRRYGSYFYFLGNGEMIPNEDCYCEIDPAVKDRWGIPVLRFHWKWGQQDVRRVAHMRQTFRAVIERLGGRVLEDESGAQASPSVGGSNNHEVGTVRMGRTPKDSVVNSFGQTWGVRNLFVMDGSVFASSADKNPTLTILALAWRNSAHLIEQARKGNL